MGLATIPRSIVLLKTYKINACSAVNRSRLYNRFAFIVIGSSTYPLNLAKACMSKKKERGEDGSSTRPLDLIKACIPNKKERGDEGRESRLMTHNGIAPPKATWLFSNSITFFLLKELIIITHTHKYTIYSG